MIVISVMQEKGGIGKTTLSSVLSAGLAIVGYRVLAIDTDAQAHLTIGMGLKPEPCLYDLIVREYDFSEKLRAVNPANYAPAGVEPRGTLAVLPGNLETMNLNIPSMDAFTLRKRLDEIEDAFDFCVIDCSPTPSFLHSTIMVASDGLLLPTEMEYYCLQALTSTLRNVDGFSDTRQTRGLAPITILGIVPNKYRPKTVEHSENYARLQEKYPGRVWEPIPLRITWAEAAMQRQSVFAYAPESEAAQDAWSVVKKIQEVVPHATQ